MSCAAGAEYRLIFDSDQCGLLRSKLALLSLKNIMSISTSRDENM
jgi:hypothetical protein